MTGQLITVVALMVLSSFFSATETAFTSFNRIKIKNMAADDHKVAALVMRLDEDYDKLLSTILVGNNIANICMTSVATVMCINLYGENKGATIATMAVTIAVLVFGEISPKSLAKEHADGFVLFAARIINLMVVVLTPVTIVFHALQKLLIKLFSNKNDKSFNEDELITIVEEAATEGTLGAEQSELITNAIEFNDLEAIDVITPRVDIVAIEKGTEPYEIQDTFKDSGLSRLPVYEDDIDNIIGVLNYKDFYNNEITSPEDVDAYVKPVAYVAQSIKASVLLKKMQLMKTHIAIVVDEYGGTMGLVTMEDIIEEIVGKIYDEHDAVELRDVTPIGNNAFTVAGGANLEKFFELFDEEIDADATTINGWIMIMLDRLPEQGDHFVYESKHKLFYVRVTKADSRRALMSYIKVEDKPDEDE
ncbi:MAG: hemolysin family protein [Firmicutes bacterium]|nr:hemolysin family protein [Bacillota bacterium]